MKFIIETDKMPCVKKLLCTDGCPYAKYVDLHAYCQFSDMIKDLIDKGYSYPITVTIDTDDVACLKNQCCASCKLGHYVEVNEDCQFKEMVEELINDEK